MPEDRTAFGLTSSAATRPPPSAVKLLLPVWGQRFIQQFLTVSLPTLLAPGNIPGLAKALPTEFVFLTRRRDEATIRAHRAFSRLAAICAVRFEPIDDLISDGNYSTTVTLAYARAVRAVGPAMVDSCFIFLVSDYIMADGSLSSVLARLRAGASAVLAGNFQIVEEDAGPWLAKRLDPAEPVLALPARELMRWALPHLHPVTMANTVNLPMSHARHANRLFWRVDAETMIGRFYLMHMIGIRPEIVEFVVGASCDYSFVPEMCPSGTIAMLTDSDEYLVVEMQPYHHEERFLRLGPIDSTALAAHLSEWTTAQHRRNAGYRLVFHAAAPPAALPAISAAADAFIAEIGQAMAPEPQPYRDHPYWRGAIAAFEAAARHKTDATGGAGGRPAFGLLRWADRLRRRVVGSPPNLPLWHPLWPDLRLPLAKLEAFLAGPSRRLLVVSETPSILTDWLGDAAPHSIRMPVWQLLGADDESEVVPRDTHELCLIEIAPCGLARVEEIIDRVLPSMKVGSQILVLVRNPHRISDDGTFGHALALSAAHILRPTVTPLEMHYVPGSRLRSMVYRSIAGLSDSLSRRSVGELIDIVSGSWRMLFRLPLQAVKLPVMLGVSLACNAAIRRAQGGKTAPRRVSSAYMVLRVERGVAPAGSRKPVDAVKARETLTKEPQYQDLLDVRDQIGIATLGLMTNQIWHDDPRRLGFILARYKFVSKMLSGRRDVAEIGCGDAFASRLVLQEVQKITVYDFDPLFIEDIRRRHSSRWPVEAHVHDILAGPLPRRHDAIFSLDVIEHIAPEREDTYLRHLSSSLAESGVLIVGSPSLESQPYGSPQSKAGHINCKTGSELKRLLERHFKTVFLFSMNDEVVHTGFYPMAHYLLALCCEPKSPAAKSEIL